MTAHAPTLRRALPPLPQRMRALPVSDLGYPVPYFVDKINGKWDFRCVDRNKLRACVAHDLCWLCGEKLGVFKTYVLGPMAAMNRISAEPPSHLECAEFAVAACPFLMLPKAVRRDHGLPDNPILPGGVHMPHNPGISLLWTSKAPVRVMRTPAGDVLAVGEPSVVRWYSEGVPANRTRALAAINEGLDQIRSMYPDEVDSEAGRRDLAARSARLMPHLPKDHGPP